MEYLSGHERYIDGNLTRELFMSAFLSMALEGDYLLEKGPEDEQ